MNAKVDFKLKMTFDEMSEAFAADYPFLTPNRSNVGRYAKKKGYRLLKQVINYKQVYFYVNIEKA